MIRTIMAATLALAVTLPAISAYAAARDRVFVASYGDDANPCTFGSPCKTFQRAVDVVAYGGEVSAIDSAGFGPVTITQAVTITSPPGVEAGIAAVSGGNAITINANTSNADLVLLRRLTLDGTDAAANGIVFNSGYSLVVDECVVRNMTNNGLSFVSSEATFTRELSVSNSLFFNDQNTGILIQTKGGGAISAAIDRTSFQDMGSYAVDVDGTMGAGTAAIGVAVTDSVASNNDVGFVVQSASNHSPSNLALTRTLVEGTINAALTAFGANATMWLAQSTLVRNSSGYQISGEVIKSYGDNYLQADNGGNNGSLTATSRQ